VTQAEGDLPSEDGRTPRERERVAYHEASHAAASWILKGRVGLVTIEPNRHCNGFAQAGGHRLPSGWSGRIDLELPPLAWPADIRRSFEVDLAAALAGPLGERALAPPRDRPADPKLYLQDLQLAAEQVRRLTRRESQTLYRWRTESPDHPRKTDEEVAIESARLLAGREAEQLLGYYRAVTARLVELPRFERLVKALVPELIAHRSVSGRRVREIFKEADCTAG
jgi:hypothetical protein